jgi:hypothetical protein
MKITSKSLAVIISVVLLAGFGVYAYDWLREGTEISGEGGERVALAQLPPAVRATIERESQGGTIMETEKIAHGGKTVYGADIVVSGAEQEMLVAEDGTLLRRGKKEGDDD